MCIMLTNLRAAYCVFGGGLALLTLFYMKQRDFRSLKAVTITIVLALILLMTLTNKPIDSMLFIVQRIATAPENLIQNGKVESAVTAEASGNTRLHIWSSLSNLMLEKKMFLGSGFAGPYLFFPEIGTAHNQYMDVFFRTGPIGLGLYLTLWLTLLIRSFKYAPELGIALITWLLFGLLHETTKFSYGAFLFFALLSLSQNGWGKESGKPQMPTET